MLVAVHIISITLIENSKSICGYSFINDKNKFEE